MNFYHYTSRLGAQDIACTRSIEPGRDGLVYLTDARYDDGVTAANELAITGKPVELGATVVVPDSVEIAGPGIVEPWRDSAGRLVREGGGREFNVLVGLSLNGSDWFTLEAP